MDPSRLKLAPLLPSATPGISCVFDLKRAFVTTSFYPAKSNSCAIGWVCSRETLKSNKDIAVLKCQ